MNQKLHLLRSILFLFCLASASTFGQTAPAAIFKPEAEKVDAYVREQMASRHIPGLSLAVLRDGQVILAKGYGTANLELSVAATEKTAYSIASITKTFTALATMMLVEGGIVSLDDPISKHLSGVSQAARAVTIRQLLNHTSGITDYEDRPFVASEEVHDGTLPDYEKWVANFTLAAPPGERWSYVGVGYFLLGRLVEKVSGKTYEKFLRERIFNPLGMNDTRLVTYEELIPNRAAGYRWKGGAFRNAGRMKPEVEFAKGGIASTALDMAKLDAALGTGRLLKRATLEQMWTNARLNNGQVVQSYGLGFGLTPFRGRKRVGHTGGGYGFATAYQRFVDEKVTVILLCNADHESISIGNLANEIASFYFPVRANRSALSCKSSIRLPHRFEERRHSEGQSVMNPNFSVQL